MLDSRPEANRSRRIWVWVVVLVLILGGGVYWYDNTGQKSPAGNPFAAGAMAGMKTPVRVAPVEKSTINIVYRAIGTVTALNTVTVQGRVDGELTEVLFEDGQKVDAGDVLAIIDPRPYQVQLDQALGQQTQNEAQLQNAQRDLQRYQTLFKQNSIAKQQVDAQAALVQQYLGLKTSDQAAVDHAALQLSFTRITAPISGRLGLRKVDAGNLISQANTDGLVVITQTQPIAVLFTLPQAQLPSVLAQWRAGKKLPVALYDSQNIAQIAAGELTSIDNQIDVATGTLTLKAQFDNADENLFPNQFVNVRLTVVADEPAIIIPTRAVQQGSRGAFVYVVSEDDIVHVQHITTGTVDGGRVAVVDGLEAGQDVVVEGVDRLREGARIERVSDEPVSEVGPVPAQPALSTGRSEPHGD